MSKRALFVSPHLGDVAFSVGAAFAALSKAGWHTVLLTVFDPNVPDLDHRRAEDERAAEILGAAETIHLGHAEAPAGERPGSDEPALALPEADETFLPQGIDGHVDHLLVVRATNHLEARRYRELPYGLRPDAPDPLPGDAFAPSGRKLDACAAYASQLEFQFGGEAKMRAALGGAQERVSRRGPASPG